MPSKKQIDKFKSLAKEAECGDDEAAFDEKLKRIASTPPPKVQKSEPKKKTKPAK